MMGERGEEWKDKGSYAAEGQFLVVEWMTNRLSAAKEWRYSSDAAQQKNMGCFTCTQKRTDTVIALAA